MYYFNQFLGQVELANKLACSRKPQDKRLAVILLDNVIEVDLKKKSQLKFFFDNTSWHKTRKHTHKERNEVERYFEPLLQFSLKNGFITEEQKQLISFCHEVRNSVSHGGSSEELLVQATLLIYYSLLTQLPHSWGVGGSGGTMASYTKMKRGKSVDVPGYENRYFPKTLFFEHKKHLPSILKQLLTYGAKRKITPSFLLSKSVTKYLSEIEKNIKALNADIPNCDLNAVFFFDNVVGGLRINRVAEIRPDRKLTLVLAYFSCLRKHQEKLADLDQMKQRTQTFVKEFESFLRKTPRYPIGALKKAHETARRMEKMDTADALNSYRSIRATFDDLSNSALDAYGRLSDYGEYQYEQMAGK